MRALSGGSWASGVWRRSGRGERSEILHALGLFSSIGYVRTVENVERTLRRIREHLAPGGVVVLEPWIEPGTWQSGRVFLHPAEAEDVTVL